MSAICREQCAQSPQYQPIRKEITVKETWLKEAKSIMALITESSEKAANRVRFTGIQLEGYRSINHPRTSIIEKALVKASKVADKNITLKEVYQELMADEEETLKKLNVKLENLVKLENIKAEIARNKQTSKELLHKKADKEIQFLEQREELKKQFEELNNEIAKFSKVVADADGRLKPLRDLRKKGRELVREIKDKLKHDESPSLEDDLHKSQMILEHIKQEILSTKITRIDAESQLTDIRLKGAEIITQFLERLQTTRGVDCAPKTSSVERDMDSDILNNKHTLAHLLVKK